MNMEAKYLWKFTLASRTRLENPLVLAIQRWKCSSKIPNDSCLFVILL